ncbi:MAG: class I SAM-dependent methyltransferase [Solirubrobacterales bacterium]
MSTSVRSNLEAPNTPTQCPTSIRVAIDELILAAAATVAGPATRWLDVGCGTGRYRELLATAGVLGGYTGVDLGLDEDRVWTDEDGTVISLLRRDASDLTDLPAASFEAALSVMAFEHIIDDRLAIAGIARTLPPGAPFVLAVPAPAGRTIWGFRHCYRWYDERAIRALADGAGLKVQRLSPVGGLASLTVNSAWFMLPYFLTKLITAGAYLVFLGKREPARRYCPWLLRLLPTLQYWHCRYAAGRRVHDMLNRLLLRADRVCPRPPLAWVAVLRTDDPPGRTEARGRKSKPA